MNKVGFWKLCDYENLGSEPIYFQVRKTTQEESTYEHAWRYLTDDYPDDWFMGGPTYGEMKIPFEELPEYIRKKLACEALGV